MIGRVNTDDETGRTVLADRYGAASPLRRRAVITGSVLLAAVFLGWLVWAIWLNSDPQVTSQLESFDVRDDHAVEVTLQVHLSDAQVEASCTVSALAADHSTVGEVTFTPDPAEGEAQRVEVATDRRATAVQSDGCTTADQSRAR